MHFDFDLQGDVKEVSRLFYRTAGNYVSRAHCARHILNSKLVHYLIVSVYNAHIELHWKIG